MTTIFIPSWLVGGNASALGAKCPGFNSWLRQEFLCLFFRFVVLVFWLFVHKHIICYKILQNPLNSINYVYSLNCFRSQWGRNDIPSSSQYSYCCLHVKECMKPRRRIRLAHTFLNIEPNVKKSIALCRVFNHSITLTESST